MEGLLPTLHELFALLSVAVYAVRGGLMLKGSDAVNGKPLLAGTGLSMLLLLATGIGMVFATGMGFNGFVITKIIGLVAYVVLGIVALKPGMAKGAAIGLWLAGLAAFVYTFMVAEHQIAPLF